MSGRNGLAAVVLVWIALASASAAAARAAAPVPETAASPGTPTALSDQRTLSRWASTNLPMTARLTPSRRARAITRLRFNTEDGVPEVYLALQSQLDRDGNEWVEVSLPMRPNGRKGWVPREALGEWHVVRTRLVIDRRRLRATLFRSGRAVFRTRVGVGKPSTPTPAGRFYVRERLRGYAIGTIYGPVALGTSAYSEKLTDWPGGAVVGIHGTNQPGLIPGRPSHGCVRMRNRAILRLAQLMPVGTPIEIR
jgi:hypothetical protein